MKLSERIVSEDELVSLGITGLKLPYHEVKKALTNHSKDIQSAAHEVLRTWLKQQTNREEAFVKIHEALKECGI